MIELAGQFQNHSTDKMPFYSQLAFHSYKILTPPPEDVLPGKAGVGRIVVSNEGEYWSQGAAGADRWWAEFGPYIAARPHLLEWECLNEEPSHDPDIIALIVAFTLRWMELARERGLTGPVLNFSEGTPEPEMAIHYAAVVEKAAEWGFSIGFHEYWAPRLHSPGMEGWHWLRFPKFFQVLRDQGITAQPKVDITECGIDRGTIKKMGGWKNTDTDAVAYADDLVEYVHTHLAQYPYVQRAFVFCMGYDTDIWRSFDITQYILMRMADSNEYEEVPEVPPDIVIKEPPIELDPWIVEHKRQMSVPEFKEFVKTLAPPKPVGELWLHHTTSPKEAWSYQTVLNVKGWYERLPWYDAQGHKHEGWTAGPHLFIGDEGIWLFSSLNYVGVHAKGHNTTWTRGIEMIGFYDDVKPSGLGLVNTIAALGILFELWGLDPNEALMFHRDDSYKTCPGRAVEKDWILGLVLEYMGQDDTTGCEGHEQALAYVSEIRVLLDSLEAELG